MLTLLCPWTEDDLDVTAAHAALVRQRTSLSDYHTGDPWLSLFL